MGFVSIHIRILFLVLGVFAMPLFLFVTLCGKSDSLARLTSEDAKFFKRQATAIHRFDTVNATLTNTSTGQQLSKDRPARSGGPADFKAFHEPIQIDRGLKKRSAFTELSPGANLRLDYGINRPSACAQRELTRITALNPEPLTRPWPLSTASYLADSTRRYKHKNENGSSRYFWGDACEHQQESVPYPHEENHRLFTDLCLALSQEYTNTPFSSHSDIDWFHVAAEFLERIRTGGFLTRVKENIFDEAPQLDLVSTLTYIDNVLRRLPKYQALFEKIAAEQDLDWRLLAAITYQESHWDPEAVSPTGVRGLMMLTKRTAKELGIDNRLDPEQSVRGGARYLNAIKQRFSPEILGIDRLWMALASYNVGFGHLQDARALTKQLGADSNKWQDVMKHLPLLSMRKWYRNTRYGYARGYESVQFVENIRSYHRVLLWLTSSEAKTILVENDLTEAQSSL